MLGVNICIVALGLVFITHNVLILNEEILILICFIAFCFVITHNFGSSVKVMFKTDLYKIERDYNNSFCNLETFLSKISEEKKHIWKSFSDFKLLGLYYINLTNHIIDLQVLKNTKFGKTPSSKKFIFVQHVENQTRRLLLFFVKDQLNSIASIKNFYVKTIPVTNFLCSGKIMFQECVQTIKK